MHGYGSIYALLQCFFFCTNHMWNVVLPDCNKTSENMLFKILQAHRHL